MIETLFSLPATIFNAIGAAFLAVIVAISSFFGYAQPNKVTIETVETATTSSEIAPEVATSSPPAVSAPAPVPKKPPPVIIPPPVVTPPPVIIIPTTTPPVATTTQTVGTTTLSVRSVPLLIGGNVHAGESVAVSYLQITNVGKEGAILKGFWVKQNGSAPGESIIGLSTVDDKGVIRDLVGGTEGATPFQNGMAFAPTNAFFAPGQLRLFTIKAIMTQSIYAYIGTQLMIEVSSVVTTAETKAQQFPIRGTTWTITQ